MAAVAGLWWWSSGAALPLAPGGPPGSAAVDPAVPANGAADPRASGSGKAGDAGATPGLSPQASPAALEAVHAAARATTDAPTAQFALTLVVGDDPLSAPQVEASGAVDVREGRVAMTMQQGGLSPSPGVVSLEAIAIADVLYLRSPSLGAPGEPPVWWRIGVQAGDSGAPAAVSGLVGLVAGAVAAEDLGDSTEGGVAIRRYRVQLGDQGTPLVGEAGAGWAVVGVTSAGVLRLVEVRGVGTWGAAEGQPVLARLVLDRVGEPVDIRPPDPAEVREAAGSVPSSGG